MSAPQPFSPTLPPLPPAPAPEQKSWFARHKIVTGFLGLVVLGAAIGAASGGSSTGPEAVAESGGSSTSSAAANETKAEDAAEKVEGSKTAPEAELEVEAPKPEMVDGLQPDGETWIYGDWKITNLKIANTEYLDIFDIAADIKYLGSDAAGGDLCFDVALGKGDRQVASGTGCADSVQPGKTATLEFFSGDDFVSGPYDITLTKSW